MMNGSKPETPVAEPEERIGKYKVHPVASMFPLLQGEKYEELRVSIEEVGQLHPSSSWATHCSMAATGCASVWRWGSSRSSKSIAGRRRRSITSRFPDLDRRHLSDDARVAICAKINQWLLTQSSAKKKAEVGAAQGHHGVEGGRGHKKPLDQESGPGVSKRDIAKKHADSTVGQLAADAKVSRHKAEQTMAVGNQRPNCWIRWRRAR